VFRPVWRELEQLFHMEVEDYDQIRVAVGRQASD
jgi:hypothetical protein